MDQKTQVALYVALTCGLVGTALLFMGLRWRYFIWCVAFGLVVFLVMYFAGAAWLFSGGGATR